MSSSCNRRKFTFPEAVAATAGLPGAVAGGLRGLGFFRKRITLAALRLVATAWVKRHLPLRFGRQGGPPAPGLRKLCVKSGCLRSLSRYHLRRRLSNFLSMC